MSSRPSTVDPDDMMPSGGMRISSPPTERELEVLAQVARGLGQKGAAEALGISVQTVKNHMSRLIRHCEAFNVEGVLFALGWTTIPTGDEIARDAKIDKLRAEIRRLHAALVAIEAEFASTTDAEKRVAA